MENNQTNTETETLSKYPNKIEEITNAKLNVGAVFIIIYSSFCALISILMLGFNDTGSIQGTVTALCVFIFSISLIVQAIKLMNLRIYIRKRRYFKASIFIILAPVIHLFIVRPFSSGFYRSLSNSNLIKIGDALNSPYAALFCVIISVIGSIWLWILFATNKAPSSKSITKI